MGRNVLFIRKEALLEKKMKRTRKTFLLRNPFQGNKPLQTSHTATRLNAKFAKSRIPFTRPIHAKLVTIVPWGFVLSVVLVVVFTSFLGCHIHLKTFLHGNCFRKYGYLFQIYLAGFIQYYLVLRSLSYLRWQTEKDQMQVKIS